MEERVTEQQGNEVTGRYKMRFKGGYKSDDQRKAIFAKLALPSLKQGKIKTNRFPIFSSQAIFSPDDKAFLDSLPETIKLGKTIGYPGYGEFEMEGYPEFKVKAPVFNIGLPLEDSNFMYEEDEGMLPTISEIEDEWATYKKYHLEEEPILAPVALKYIELNGEKYPILVRPNLKSLTNKNKQRITNKQLEDLRDKLLAFSRKGFHVNGLEIGIDKHGELYTDTNISNIVKEDENSEIDPILSNDFQWITFLNEIGKNGEILGLDTEKRVNQFLGDFESLSEKDKKLPICDDYIKWNLATEKAQILDYRWKANIPEFKLYYKKIGIPVPQKVSEAISFFEKYESENKKVEKKPKKRTSTVRRVIHPDNQEELEKPEREQEELELAWDSEAEKPRVVRLIRAKFQRDETLHEEEEMERELEFDPENQTSGDATRRPRAKKKK